ncbi:MAG: hypothetical protein CL567_03605 [Alphaproteobacteria bacterium]|nr:hypothetical protein [Alphaproteobacteria bacterium]
MHIKPVKICILFCMLITISACSSNFTNVKHLQSESGSFNTELAAGYRDLAIFEAEEMYDWPDANRFAKKALLANTGQPPLPENPKDRVINTIYQSEVEKAYNKLNTALLERFADYSPLNAAKAQIAFDCWVEQLEEGWQFNHIAACRRKFDNAMLSVKNNSTFLEKVSNIEDKSRSQSQVSINDSENNTIRKCETSITGVNHKKPLKLYFLHNESKLREIDNAVLIKMAKEVESGSISRILVIGHTDSSGTKPYNLKLSMKRATQVWAALVGNGVNPKIIWLSAHGELSTSVKNIDGSREPKDRRAIVRIEDLTNSLTKTNRICDKEKSI